MQNYSLITSLVTGFGLAGHLHEMLSASACAASINWSGVPTFAETVDLFRDCRL